MQLITRIKLNALQHRSSDIMPEANSTYRQYSTATRLIHDDLKSTPFKMHAEPVKFNRNEYRDLTFSDYLEYFGFFGQSNYEKLEHMGYTARLNADVMILEQDTYIPYHFFRPKVEYKSR